MTLNLGRLEKLDLRNVWLSESSHFTPWLAQPENLAVLADAVGLELELEGQERNVGPFRADILCKDVESEQWVLIENQLERTDHTHLGQLLTYAAGLQAVTIVWIAARFTEEHRATLDWLNEITDERFRFFGLEVELWRIGDSPPAPKFNIVSKPNDWSRNVGQAAKRIESEALTDTRQKQLAFWTMFRELLDARGGALRGQKPSPQHWMNFKIGRSGFVLAATLNSTEKRAGVELYLNGPNAKADFQQLAQHRTAIQNETGFELTWIDKPERKGSRIAYFRDDVDVLNEHEWPQIADWLRTHLELLHQAFHSRVRALAGKAEIEDTRLSESAPDSA